MTGVAQSLPVGASPEQGVVASVGNDVVKVGGHCHTPCLLTVDAQGVSSEVALARLLPA